MTDIVTHPGKILQRPSPFQVDGPQGPGMQTPVSPQASQSPPPLERGREGSITIAIENCNDLAIHNGIINIRGSELFQAKLADAYLITYKENEKKLLMMFPRVNIETHPKVAVSEMRNGQEEMVPKDMTVQYLVNSLPSTFFKIAQNGDCTCINIKMMSFIRFTDGEQKQISILFSNGIPMAMSVNDVQPFARLCELMEMVRN